MGRYVANGRGGSSQDDVRRRASETRRGGGADERSARGGAGRGRCGPAGSRAQDVRSDTQTGTPAQGGIVRGLLHCQNAGKLIPQPTIDGPTIRSLLLHTTFL